MKLWVALVVYVGRSQMCPMNYDPVCGDDGHTYSNACVAGTQGATVAHHGACGSSGGSQTTHNNIPADCTEWYDGCNNCQVSNGQISYCTERACFRQGRAYCRTHRSAPSPSTSHALCANSPPQFCRMLCPPSRHAGCPAGQCLMRIGSCCTFNCQSAGGNTGGVPAGGHCSTTRTRGNGGIIQSCVSGYSCHITNPGHPEVDMPNSGTCEPSGSTGATCNPTTGPQRGPCPMADCAAPRPGCQIVTGAFRLWGDKDPSGGTCCRRQCQTSCATTYNCMTREVWSAAKQTWCCANQQRGCPAHTGTRHQGQTCGYVFGLGQVGSCAEGLACTAYQQHGGAYVADAPSTCQPSGSQGSSKCDQLQDLSTQCSAYHSHGYSCTSYTMRTGCRHSCCLEAANGGNTGTGLYKPSYALKPMQQPVYIPPHQPDNCNYGYKNECQMNARHGCTWSELDGCTSTSVHQ